jgi:hypothetical protein
MLPCLCVSPLLRRLAAACAVAAALTAHPLAASAIERDSSSDGGAPVASVLNDHGWRFMPLSQMLEQSQRQYLGSRGMPRLLPLAMMPMHQSALWLGLSSPRGDSGRNAGVQVELRWSIPLDRIGGVIEIPALALR